MSCIDTLGLNTEHRQIRDLTQRVESLETYGNNALAIIAEGAVPGADGPPGPEGPPSTVPGPPGQGGNIVVGKPALAALTNMLPGVAYFVSDGAASGDFVWKTGDFSALVAIDPRKGVYVAPSSDTSGASGAWVRQYFRGVLSASWFGVLADGVIDEANNTATGTDDTVAIQATWDFAKAIKGAKILYSVGVHIIAGAFKTEGGVNAQLILPWAPTIDNQGLLHISGGCAPSLSGGTNKGTIFVSTRTDVPDNSQIWSIVGCKDPAGSSSRSWFSLYFDNMIFRVPQNSRISGLDLRYVHQYGAHRYRIDVIGGFGTNGPNGITLKARKAGISASPKRL